MAQTGIATGDGQAVKIWQEKLYRDVVKGAYFSKFMNQDSNSLINVKNDFEKKQGDRMTFAIRMRLSGAGVTEGQTLEGNEESLTSYTHTLSLAEKCHAVRDAGPMTRQRAMFDVSAESEQALRDWGSEKVDLDCMTSLTTSPTKVFYGGTASATTNVTTSDKLTPALITKIATWAKTGGNRAYVPFRPIRVDGGEYYVLLVHPDVGYDLQVDTTWAQAQRDAQARSEKNPIFTGALGMWSNVIVHSHENVPVVTNWGAGANVAGSKCVFMGAQALCFAWGRKPQVVQKTFDYDRQIGYGMSMIYNVNKPVFNSLDYGSAAVYVNRTQIS